MPYLFPFFCTFVAVTVFKPNTSWQIGPSFTGSLKSSPYQGPSTCIPSFKFSAVLRRGRESWEGRTTKNRPLSMFSEGLQSVDSHLAGGRFIIIFSIKQCLHYRLPPPLSFRALFNSGGAWPELQTDQRCKIKRFQHVYFMLSLMEGLKDTFHPCIKRTFLSRKESKPRCVSKGFIFYIPGTQQASGKAFKHPCVCEWERKGRHRPFKFC